MKKFLQAMTLAIASILFITGCVPTRRWRASEAALNTVRADSAQQAGQINDLQGQVGQLKQQVGDLNKKVTDLTAKNADLNAQNGTNRNQLNMSKEQLEAQRKRLAEMQALMDNQKRAIQEIRQKMSDALVGFNSNELTVSVKNGKVYVSLQENLLFPSGSAVVNPKGKEALGKLAQVLNNNPEITVDIEGHTDSVPIRGRYEDNWALSVARATAIVRVLTKTYLVDPVRVVASGHSSYDPVQTNSTPDGRALNRRTEIILSPKLDELFQLLGSSPEGGSSGQ
jgi:chemotaxis protein MotB